MSEKKIRIETTQDDGSSTVGRTPPAEKRRKGLPAAGEGWKASEHDMVVMGRLSRAIEGVPSAAMRRIAPWFSSLLAEAMTQKLPSPEVAVVGVQQWPGWGNAGTQGANAQLTNQDNPQANWPKKLG